MKEPMYLCVDIDDRYGDMWMLANANRPVGVPRKGDTITIDNDHVPLTRWKVTTVDLFFCDEEKQPTIYVEVRPAKFWTAMRWRLGMVVYKIGRRLFLPNGRWWRNRWLEPYASDPVHDRNHTYDEPTNQPSP